MDDLFNPSLLISLGPSSGKALELSRKLLSYLPRHFLELVEFYDAKDLGSVRKDLQCIIDNTLLSAKHLNRLVDMGFKVRNDNLDSVKINVYLLWDVYSSSLSGYEVLKILSELNYGNVDRDLHTGATIYIIPILEKEWELEEERKVRAIGELEESISYMSTQDRLLAIDSRAYILHCVSSDGSRIPREELEYIASLLVYMNVIPSKDPPLAHFNRRLIKSEGSYKIGSVGITSLTVFVDQLRESFARCLSIDILSHSTDYDSEMNLLSNRAFEIISYDNQKSRLMKTVSLVQDNNCYRLNEALTIDLPRDIYQYPKLFKNWEEYIENNYLISAKNRIEVSISKNNREFTSLVDSEVEAIAKNHSLKTAVGYLNKLEEEIKNVRSRDKTSTTDDLSMLNKKFQRFISNYPNTLGMVYRVVILTAFLMYSMVNLLFPHIETVFRVLSVGMLVMLMSAIACLDYLYKRKKINYFITKYKEEIFRKSGTLLNLFIERMIVENNKVLLKHIKSRREEIGSCIKNVSEAKGKISPESVEDEKIGNMITSLLDSRDRKRFYRENRPDMLSVYSGFTRKIKHYLDFKEEGIEELALDYSREISGKYVSRDFYDYLRFKYGDEIENEIVKWVDKGVIKSKYLLQYINSERLEEHSIFITSPEVYKMTKDMISSKLGNFNVSIIEGDNIYTNCISIIRLCFGIDFDKISAVKNLRRGK